MPRSLSAALVSLCLFGAASQAQTVTPVGDLQPCALAPGIEFAYVGTLTGNPPSFLNPSDWDFWTFEGEAGQVIEFEMDRAASELDPALAIWQGDPSGVLLSSFNNPFASTDGSISFLGFFDDEDPAAIPGPFGDPFGTFTLPADGTYFVIAFGNSSDPGAPSYDYSIRANSLATITNVTASTSHPTIQDAINNASDFDLIEFGCGLIRESGIVVDRPVSLRGDGATTTIIDAQRNDRVFGITAASAGSAFEGFTVVSGLTTFDGGGFYLSPGAALSLDRINVRSCEANDGGAISVDASPGMPSFLHATNCDFRSNVAVNPGTGGGTGGVFSSTVGEGGAFTFINCLFLTNFSDGDGAAFLLAGGGKVLSLINCTFAENNVFGLSQSLIQTCCGSLVNIVNCVFGPNPADNIIDFGLAGSSIASSIYPASFVLVDINDNGGNLVAGATFDGLGQYRLAEGSLGIDAADFQAYDDFGTSFLDLGGAARFNDDPGVANTGFGAIGTLDMGAYEFQGVSCRADINGDGLVDTADLGIILGAFGTSCTLH